VIASMLMNLCALCESKATLPAFSDHHYGGRSGTKNVVSFKFGDREAPEI
jgi:hypothetical protein